MLLNLVGSHIYIYIYVIYANNYIYESNIINNVHYWLYMLLILKNNGSYTKNRYYVTYHSDFNKKRSVKCCRIFVTVLTLCNY